MKAFLATGVHRWRGLCIALCLAMGLTACPKGDQPKAPEPSPTLSLSANPTIVANGSFSTLTWSSSGTTACTASSAWAGTRPTSGSATTAVLLTGNYTYVLNCASAVGPISRSVEITVLPPGPDDFPPTTGTPSCSNILPGQFSCVLGGRSYLLFVPNAYGAGVRAVPLVIDMHGFQMSVVWQQSVSTWDALASARGFIVAYPQGVSDSWNAQGFCCGTSQADDVQFIRDVVADIQSHGRIVATRIYATGVSNGGSMAHTLACEATDLFAGIAPVAFTLSGGVTSSSVSNFDQIVAHCRPSRPIPVIAFHGRADEVFNYYTETSDRLSAQEGRRAWAVVQHCATGITTTAPTAGTTCEISSGCDGGVQTALCSVDGGGHILYPYVGNPGLPAIAWDFFEGFHP